MKLKYYLRGMGIGIILTAIVMGFALGGRKGTLSDAEVIKRARALGMVEAGNGTLSEAVKEESTINENDASSSGETLDQEGKEIFEKEQQTVSSPDKPVSEVAQKEEEGKSKDSEGKDVASEASTAGEENAGEVVDTIEIQNTDPKTKEQTDAASAGDQTTVANQQAEPEKPVASEEDKPQDTALAVNTASENAAEDAAALVSTVQGKTIMIPGGSDSDRVAEILFNEGFVDSSTAFNKYLIETGMDRKIRSGSKLIPDGANYEQIAAIITSG